MISLGTKWAKVLISQPESGMGYQVATVQLVDGRKFERVMIVGGSVTGINGDSSIPFEEQDIASIVISGR